MRRRFMSQSDYLQPMYFEAIEDGLTIRLPFSDIEYRIGIDGEWQTLSAGESTPSINSGTKIFFKKEGKGNLGTFSTNVGFRLGGDCRSLLHGEKVTKDSPLYEDCFYGLFFESLLVEVEDNILPATDLALYCYSNMFYGCTSLVNAPELPATTLADYCYEDMFYGCTNLNYIKMLATDISALNCLEYWVKGVSTTGTFVKNKDATWNVVGESGVPKGWTVIDDTFPTNEDGFPESTEFSFPLYLNFPKEPVYEDEYGEEYELGGDVVSALCDWIKNLPGDYYYFDSSKAIFINGTPVDRIIKYTGNAEIRGIDEFTEVGLDFSINALYGYKEKL